MKIEQALWQEVQVICQAATTRQQSDIQAANAALARLACACQKRGWSFKLFAYEQAVCARLLALVKE